MEQTVGGKTAQEVFKEPRLAALAHAACKGDAATVEREIRNGADPNGKGFEGTTPLFWAEHCENLAGMEALLRAGADPNYKFPGRGGFSAVGAAASIKNPAVLKLLLKYGGDPNTTFEESPWTALRVAMSFGVAGHGWDNYYTLLNAGADINLEHSGGTIGKFAAAMNQFGKLSELLERGYNRDLKDVGGIVQVSWVSPDGPDAKAKTNLITMLEQRGVHFPVPSRISQDSSEAAQPLAKRGSP